MSSTERGKSLIERRKREGWEPLSCWLDPEAARALDTLRGRSGQGKQDVICALLRAAIADDASSAQQTEQ